MSSSLPAPEDATSSSALGEDDVGRTNVVVAGENSDKKSKSPRPPPRSKSASLLTQALATNYEAEEDDVVSAVAAAPLLPTADVPSSSTPSTFPPSIDSTAETLCDDVNGREHIETGLREMAVVAPSPNGDVRPTRLRHDFLSDSSQTLSPVDSFSFFSLPRDTIMTPRGRGTSLERTSQERKVESPVHGPVVNNPGDTGLSGNVTPQSPVTPDLLSNPPTEGMRARYRSWRDARPVAAERTWSIGQQSSEESGQVENSIKDAIAGIGSNNRSRKASHSMRFFKEGLPEDKSKRKESKNRSNTRDGSTQSSRSITLAEQGISKDSTPTLSRNHTQRRSPLPSPHQAAFPVAQDHKSPNGQTSDTINAGYFDAASHDTSESIPMSEELLKSLPAQLLEDIRKVHNLTPGAHKGTSFSQSLPVIESEKSLPDVPLSASPELEDGIPTQDVGEDSEAHHSKTDEDDDSGTEHIFSAVFLPHQKTHKESDEEEEEEDNVAIPEASLGQPSHRQEKPEKAKSQQWLEEHEVPSRALDDKSSNNQKVSKPPPSPRFQKTPSPYAERDTYFVEESKDRPKKTRVSSHGQATPAKDDFSANEEDLSDTTPTGSLIRQDTITLPKVQEPMIEEPKPLDAIELIPYRHQVGGHTTMWRFSKRAVCKQLNNRENEFYENVERLHPKLCKFLPRYIGVLNVTFLEKQRKKPTKKEGIDEKETSDKPIEAPTSTTAQTAMAPSTPVTQPAHTRVISQSLQSSSVPIPTVTFAANRHIMPRSLLRPLGPFGDPHYRSKSDSEAPVTKSLQHESNGSSTEQTATDGDYSREDTTVGVTKTRPTLEDKHADSWGYTIKNKDLRNKVFDEVFKGSPMPVHHHKKGATHRRSLPHRNPAALRSSNSESSLGSPQPNAVAGAEQPVEESMRRRALKTAASMRRPSLTSMTTPEALESARLLGIDQQIESGPDDKTGTSAPEYDSKPCPNEVPITKHKRRYSSGGLRRKPTEVAEGRGNLKYFEEADDAGYKGDGEEEEVFSMDLGSSTPKLNDIQAAQSLNDTTPVSVGHTQTSWPDTPEATMLPAAPTSDEGQSADVDLTRPPNPKEAQAQQDARVVYFLLLEDLTAGMKKPCIMDLKMGTRQYGVDANEKKQKSQRQKCEATTSRELGVRVCGLQVWDVKTQSYIFQDKYYGRDLKAGQEFRGALERFLFDGVDHQSVLRRIPTILKKLADLEILVATLKGYRFYAASLLMFYDGDTTDEGESDSTATEKDFGSKKKQEIDFKIADFANCVIKEDDLAGRLCPPRHLDEPDRGFLRGLRSLRIYFRAIEKDLQRRELGRSRNDVLGLDGNSDDVYTYDDDEGEVSF